MHGLIYWIVSADCWMARWQGNERRYYGILIDIVLGILVAFRGMAVRDTRYSGRRRIDRWDYQPLTAPLSWWITRLLKRALGPRQSA
jgi:hypothetical protein